MLRRIGLFLLLVVFVIGMGGYYPAFKIEQFMAHREAARRLAGQLPLSELEVIEVRAGSCDVTLEQEGQELLYQGKLYDVLRTDTVGATIRYYCVNDAKEDALFARLDQLEQDAGNTGLMRKNSNLLKLFSLIYLPGTRLRLQAMPGISLKPQSVQVYFPSRLPAEILRPPGA